MQYILIETQLPPTGSLWSFHIARAKSYDTERAASDAMRHRVDELIARNKTEDASGFVTEGRAAVTVDGPAVGMDDDVHAVRVTLTVTRDGDA